MQGAVAIGGHESLVTARDRGRDQGSGVALEFVHAREPRRLDLRGDSGDLRPLDEHITFDEIADFRIHAYNGSAAQQNGLIYRSRLPPSAIQRAGIIRSNLRSLSSGPRNKSGAYLEKTTASELSPALDLVKSAGRLLGFDMIHGT